MSDETPEPESEPISRAEWAACILMGFGLVATIALMALRMWRCELGAVGLVGAGAYLMGQLQPSAPQVIHNHHGPKSPPRA